MELFGLNGFTNEIINNSHLNKSTFFVAILWFFVKFYSLFKMRNAFLITELFVVKKALLRMKISKHLMLMSINFSSVKNTCFRSALQKLEIYFLILVPFFNRVEKFSRIYLMSIYSYSLSESKCSKIPCFSTIYMR